MPLVRNTTGQVLGAYCEGQLKAMAKKQVHLHIQWLGLFPSQLMTLMTYLDNEVYEAM